jgi:hypothetical protein
MVVCSAWLATGPFHENDGMDTSSARPSMAGVSGARRTARRASGGEHGGVEGRVESYGATSRSQGVEGQNAHRRPWWQHGARRPCRVGACPLGPNVEHVVCIAVSNLESMFGLVPVKFGPRSNYKVCCTPNDLQVLFKGHGDLSSRSCDN